MEWPTSRRRIPTLAASLLAVVLGLLAGCASSPGPLEGDALLQALRTRGLDPEQVVLPWGLTHEMRQWAHEVAPRTFPPSDRLRVLSEALLTRDMKLEYTWGYTGAAVEVFEQRRANCLSFTNLFLGMAREIGVPVYFLAVEDVKTFRKEGDLVVVSDHVAVGYGDFHTDLQVFDFSEYRNTDYRDVKPISDLTAISMFHSNRGAETLQEGRIEEALDWLRMAVAVEPELAPAWVNLGVTLRRSGDMKAAEEAYKRALEVDPRTYSAYQNLTALLNLQGRHDEAAGFQEALKKAPSRNPYSYLSLGDISLRGGRLEEARRFYRRAVNLSRGDAEIYAALGQLAVARGDLREARKMLRKAQKLDLENERAERLAHMITGGTS